MSLFTDPAEHAANPPASWVVAKAGDRWQLRTAAGGVLDRFERKRDAEEAKTSGHLVALYDKERRWYAGEQVPGWKPYVPRDAAKATAATQAAPMRTLADFRRAATPGSRWTCTNHFNPGVSGPRVITGGRTAIGYTGTRADGSPIDGGALDIPKATAARVDGDSVHFLTDDGRVSFTWTREGGEPPQVDQEYTPGEVWAMLCSAGRTADARRARIAAAHRQVHRLPADASVLEVNRAATADQRDRDDRFRAYLAAYADLLGDDGDEIDRIVLSRVIPAEAAAPMAGPGIVKPGMRVMCDPRAMLAGVDRIAFGVIESVGPKFTRVRANDDGVVRPVANDAVQLDVAHLIRQLPADPRHVELPFERRAIDPRTRRWLPYWSWMRWTVAEHQAYARGERPREDAPAPAPRRLVIVSCGGVKRDYPDRAGDIYTGSYFRKASAAAAALVRDGDDYQVILSAKYGLLDLGDEIAPYDVRMGDAGCVSVETIEYQARQLGLLDAPEVIVLAGRAYADVVTAVWPHAVRPLDGTAGIGEQLQRLTAIERTGALPEPPALAAPADAWADFFGQAA